MQYEVPITSPKFVNKYLDLSPRAGMIQVLREQKDRQKKMEYLERLVNEASASDNKENREYNINCKHRKVEYEHMDSEFAEL